MLTKKYSIRVTALFLLAVGLLYTSCEKEVNIDFPEGEPVVVVEGYVENGQIPYVVLTNTVPFLGKLSPDEFEKYFISGADVTITDGINTAKLVEYKLPDLGFTVYSLDTADIFNSAKLIGKEGRTYSLSVTVNGKNYTASTTILPVVPLDSIWVEPKRSDSNLVQLMCRLSDPAGAVNFYRGLTRRNNDPVFDTGFRSVYLDIIVNGKSFNFSLDRGKADFANNDTADFEKYGYFERGDTIYVKWCAIDKPQFDFWDTFDSQGSSLGNPFSAPLKIKSNIVGKGSTGIWASYGAFYDTLIVKK